MCGFAHPGFTLSLQSMTMCPKRPNERKSCRAAFSWPGQNSQLFNTIRLILAQIEIDLARAYETYHSDSLL